MPLIRNLLELLAKNVLIPLWLTTAASTTDAAIHKKMFGSGYATLIISNKELEDIMKIINFLDDSGLLIKGVSETIKNEARGQKEEFLGMSLGTLGASLLGNLLTGKVIIRARKETNRASENF